MLGAVPSNLIPYFDFNRFAEYMVDGAEIPPTSPAQLDANVRAVAIVDAAQGDIAQAARRGDFYELSQLRDLVTAGKTQVPAGQQILSLIADLAWCRASRRKRYTKSSPQGEDPACEIAEKLLERLRFGERIFVLDGVARSDGTGVYGEEPERAGLMEGGQLVAESLDRAVGLWGCKTNGPPKHGGPGCC